MRDLVLVLILIFTFAALLDAIHADYEMEMADRASIDSLTVLVDSLDQNVDLWQQRAMDCQLELAE